LGRPGRSVALVLLMLAGRQSRYALSPGRIPAISVSEQGGGAPVGFPTATPSPEPWAFSSQGGPHAPEGRQERIPRDKRDGGARRQKRPRAAGSTCSWSGISTIIHLRRKCDQGDDPLRVPAVWAECSEAFGPMSPVRRLEQHASGSRPEEIIEALGPFAPPSAGGCQAL